MEEPQELDAIDPPTVPAMDFAADAAGAAEREAPAPEVGKGRRPASDEEILFCLDEFLYHGELRDFARARHSFERISFSLGTEDFDALVPPCLEVLEFSNQFIRNDTLLCLMYISLGCTLCDVPGEELVAAMRRHAQVLAQHDALQMFVRSLDFLLGHDSERTPVEDGMLEREFRLIFNCIYIQLLFNEHDEGFVQSLELGQGRLGASLVSLLFEATKMCADNDKIPIKKVTLLLLRVLQCLLVVPDHVLYPMPDPDPATQPTWPLAPGATAPSAGGLSPGGQVASTAGAAGAAKASMGPPRLREFQAFTAMHVHERGIMRKYSGCGRPAAIEEGLRIIKRYKDDFIRSYSFHPSEVNFMQSAAFLHDAYQRFLELRESGETAPLLPDDAPVPASLEGMPAAPSQSWASGLVDSVLGTLAPVGGGAAPKQRDRLASSGDEASDATSDAASDAASSVCASDATASDAASDATAFGPSSEPEPFADERPPPATTGVPRAPGLREPSAAGEDVFQRLYLAIFPRLTETVVLLLRLLLTSCSNVENYPGVVDMARERHATGVAEDAGGAERTLLAGVEQAMPTEAAEAHRHREIMAAAVSGVVLILLKEARRSAAEQFSSLAQLITDSNGALVVLKFLNQDLSAATEPRDLAPVLPCLRDRPALPVPWLASWPACATLRLVEALYLLCKDSPERVRKYLIHYKAPFILKRLHRIENQQVQGLVLKLLKKQIRYLPRKWKQANMKSISAIYSTVPTSPLEDWLLNEPLGEVATEGPSQAEIRSNNVVYNASLLRHISAGGGPRAGGGEGAGGAVAPWEGLATSAGPSAALSAALLGDDLRGEPLGYAQLFPEYVPACCR